MGLLNNRLAVSDVPRGFMFNFLAQIPASSSSTYFALVNSLGHAHAQRNNGGQNCFMLTKSTACPEARNFSVRAVDDFKNVEEFDTYVNSSTAGSEEYDRSFGETFGCKNDAAKGQRYHRGFLCSFLITQGGCPENIEVEKPGLQVLCKKQCDQFISSTRGIFFDPVKCTSTPTNEQIAARADSIGADSQFAIFCALVSESLDASSGQCFSGLNSEFNKCGFTSSMDALQYCSNAINSADPCCAVFDATRRNNVEKNNNENISIFGLNVPKNKLIVGAPIVGVGALALIGFISFLIIRKRRRSKYRDSSSIASSSLELKDNDGSLEIGKTQGQFADSMNRDVLSNEYFDETKRLNNPLGTESIYNQATAPGFATSNLDTFTDKMGTDARIKTEKRNNNAYTTGITYVSTNIPDNNTGFENPSGVASGAFPTANYNRGVVRVVRPYTAELSDELTLVLGDIIQVGEIFDDDWAVGKNESTGEVGMFPMVCVKSIENSGRDADSPGYSKNIKNRGNSLVYSANSGL